MNILVAINKNYVRPTNVLLNSIGYSNNKENFNIYILNKNLDKDDLENITEGLDLNRFIINNIKIPKCEIDTFPVLEKRYPEEIYFRLYASKYLPKDLDRVLYLDADTLVINSLKEFYETDFEGNFFIAATHIKKCFIKLMK